MADETEAAPVRPAAAAGTIARGTHAGGRGEFSRSRLTMMWRAFIGSPLRDLLFWVSFGILRADRRDRLRPGAAQPLEPAFLRRDRAAQPAGLPPPADGVRRYRRRAAGAQRRAGLAEPAMLHIKLREGLVRDLLDEWMRPRPRASGCKQSGEHRRQPRPAPARGCLAPRRPLGRPRHRPRRRRACCWSSFIGVLWAISEGFVFHYRRPQLRHPRLHGVGGTRLCGRRVRHLLAARPAADPAERRPLCARGRACAPSLVRVNDGIGDDHAGRRRGRGEGQAGSRPRRRAAWRRAGS